MNDLIYIQCPTCQTKYQVSLEVVSAGRSKAKCGHCHTSFVIKDNMVNQSFLNEAAIENTSHPHQNPNVTSPFSKDTTDQVHHNSHNTHSYPHNVSHQRADKPAVMTERVFNEEFGKEWSLPADDLNDYDRHYDLDNTPSFEDKKLYDLSNASSPDGEDIDSYKTFATLPIDLHGAPLYYQSTNADVAVPFERITFKPVFAEVSTTLPRKPSKIAPYITSIVWSIGCLFLVLLLAAQYTFFNIDNLVKDPSKRRYLQSFCNVFTCAVNDANLSQLSIGERVFRSSSIRPNSTDIMATINNNSTHDQLFPNILVKIYGSNGIIGDFVVMPEDYLLTPQRTLGQTKVVDFMLTVPVENNRINDVEITPFY